jgi:hypothetical protein
MAPLPYSPMLPSPAHRVFVRCLGDYWDFWGPGLHWLTAAMRKPQSRLGCKVLLWVVLAVAAAAAAARRKCHLSYCELPSKQLGGLL